MSAIKNIIFDLGGVIINLDMPKTIQEFNLLSNMPFQDIYTQHSQTAIFDQFDKGHISEDDFFNFLLPFMTSKTDREKMLRAWNAMLLDFPEHRLDELLKLKKQYRLFLLSNTNETHVTEFEKHLFESTGYKNLEPFFEKVYYSCRMGMRKPDPEIFLHVLNENGLTPEETLFIDDTQKHVNGALSCGIQAHLLEPHQEFKTLLTNLNLI